MDALTGIKRLLVKKELMNKVSKLVDLPEGPNENTQLGLFSRLSQTTL